jgi:hypothetical protein
MDPDRKSAVSSFYGGKSSFDALNSDFPRGNVDLLSGGHLNSAGYNLGSFVDAGRQEPLKGGRDEEGDVGLHQDDGWDVYADFNNVGPKYSTAFGQNDAGYRQIPLPDKKGDVDTGSTLGPVEMVTVPALGPEWKASEMRAMTKAGKKEQKSFARRKIWQDWRRDERGFCGGWLTRKLLVFTLFGLCAIIGIVLAFTIPRVPGFEFNNDTPLIAATGSFNSTIPIEFSRAPANFTFPAFAALQVDTNSNFLPLTFSHISAQVYDLDTNMQVATGYMGHHTLPAKSFADMNLPLNFTYVATNDSDPTWRNWYDACKNSILDTGGIRPAVTFRLLLDLKIVGLPSSYGASTQVSGAPCPIELSTTSV